jgi:hypothetical protein
MRYEGDGMLTMELPQELSAQICADVKIKVAVSRSERQAAFELVYRSYLRSGLCGENEHGLRCTHYQLLPTTDIIIAQLRGQAISTMSLVRDSEFGLPLEQVYPAEVAARRAAGQRLAEVSCLADRRQDPARFFGLFREMGRLMAQLGRRTGVDELLVAVHPRHAPLYRRYMAFVPLGDRREYPTVQGNPALALTLNFARAQRESVRSWQEFFGEPLPDEVLRTCPITVADREYFAQILAETCCEDVPGTSYPAARDHETAAAVELLCA